MNDVRATLPAVMPGGALKARARLGFHEPLHSSDRLQSFLMAARAMAAKAHECVVPTTTQYRTARAARAACLTLDREHDVGMPENERAIPRSIRVSTIVRSSVTNANDEGEAVVEHCVGRGNPIQWATAAAIQLHR